MVVAMMGHQRSSCLMKKNRVEVQWLDIAKFKAVLGFIVGFIQGER
jgi:hypothetical protein